jgi:signal transduction histidine kinase
MAAAYVQWNTEYTWRSVLQDLLLVAAAWSLGDASRTRRQRAEALAERAREAERNREAHSREAVVNERLRIARELHDVMAHSMSVIAVQAGVGRHVMDRDPETARRALDVIENTSRRSLTEMRQLLGVLRVDDVPETGEQVGPADTATRSPQPGLARLEELLAAARSAGLVVTLSMSGTPRPVPAQLDLAAYRILQEALTNAAKHAGPAEVTVTLRWTDDSLRIEVSDDGRGPVGGRRTRAAGEGYGLIGLRERATSVGGDLLTGPGPRGGFLLRATLPLADDRMSTSGRPQ